MASVAGCDGGDSESIEIRGNQCIAQTLDVQPSSDAGVPEEIGIERTAGLQETDARAESSVRLLDAQQESPDLLAMDNG